MNTVKQMRMNLNRPGALPKTNEHPMKTAITLRRKNKVLKPNGLTNSNEKTDTASSDINLEDGEFNE